MSPARLDPLDADESLVDLRCAVVVIDRDEVLLVERHPQRTGSAPDWVLPGGRPRPGESMQSCARRETREETGVRVDPQRVAFVAEVTDPDSGSRIVELVFWAQLEPEQQRPSSLTGEAGTTPAWVTITALPKLNLRPPIAGYLPGLASSRTHATAAYLGNLWRPVAT